MKWYAALHTAKGRAAAKAFLVEGARTVRQIGRTAPHRVIELVYSEGMEVLRGLTVPSRTISRTQFRAIGLSQHPAGPVAVVELPPGWDSAGLPSEPGRKILVLEDVQDPGNVGALVRSAAAFDFSGVVMSDKCADPFSPKAVQSSCGAIVSVWVRRSRDYRDMMMELKRRRYKVVAADIRGTEPRGTVWPDGLVIVLGNEGSGVSAETLRMADEVVRIPFNDDKVESLNVAASGAICMYVSTVLKGDPRAAVAL